MSTPTLAELGAAQATQADVAAYLGVALFVLVGAACVGLTRLGRTALLGTAAQAGVLAMLYPVALLNRFVVARPDGALVSLSAVALNALVWAVLLPAAAAWFEPPAWLPVGAIPLLVAWLALGSLGSENARYMALLLLVPIGGIVGVAAALDRRWRGQWWRWPPQRAMFVVAAVAVPGVWALVAELLGPAFGGVVGAGTAALFMLAQHVLLVPLAVLVALPAPVARVVAPRADDTTAAPEAEDNEILLPGQSLGVGY